MAPGIESDEPIPPAPDFSCAIRRETDRVVVSVEGEVDIATAPVLYATLRDAAGGSGSSVVADFADVTFIDSSGVQCLLAAQRDAESLGTTLGVHGPRPNVLLVFDLLGLTDRLVVEGAS
ncbi:MAG: anti-anti-sigma factor [Actinomycetia bacterium]|nr:anti-anti-sigma factor [Actinomycetes bacterium]